MERRDPLMTELEAMAVISRVLETLPDAARQRVLRWAAERAGIDTLARSAAVGATASVVPPADDPALKIDSLEDMFGKASLVEHDLAVVVFEEPVVVASDPSKAPVAEVLRSFAAEFQRFAEEWNGAAA